MSIKTIADLSTPLNSEADNLHNASKNLHEILLTYWKSDRGLSSCSQAELDENSHFAINIPALKFCCLSKQRLVFREKNLLAEIDFHVHNNETDISVLKCYLDTYGNISFDETDDILDFYSDPYVPAKILSKLFSAASNKKIISI
ncbi:hypothetical protein [Pantoea vagans]|uniref:hypothetical protein n=1 Tax=Pantoea vagans TaxID=470934 RepID=UPI00076AF988|nr:hypothetical protein [Pantoea vagans]AMG57748.1 hypothetical protein AL522_08915 [Pantoea vagans]